MTIRSLDVCSNGTTTGDGSSPTASGLDHYVESSNQKLDALTLCARRGEFIEGETRYWIMGQIEFLVQTISDAQLELNEDLRSNLLHLLLAFANLHEYIRSREPAGARLD